MQATKVTALFGLENQKNQSKYLKLCKQILSCFRDDSRYPPNFEKEVEYIREEGKERACKRAIESLMRRAYYLKSVGGIPKGKSCRIDKILKMYKK